MALSFKITHYIASTCFRIIRCVGYLIIRNLQAKVFHKMAAVLEGHEKGDEDLQIAQRDFSRLQADHMKVIVDMIQMHTAADHPLTLRCSLSHPTHPPPGHVTYKGWLQRGYIIGEGGKSSGWL